MAQESRKRPPRTAKQALTAAPSGTKANTCPPIPVIMLLGETGVGKSTFISAAGKKLSVKPEIGHGLAPCTQAITKYFVQDPEHPGHSVCLIDTPGFNDDSALDDDYKQLGILIEWLEQEPQAELDGILYLMDIGQTRVVKCARRMDPTKIPDPPAVRVVTTKWTQSSKSQRQKDEKKEKDIQHLFRIPSYAMKRFDNGNEEQGEQTAWEILNDVQINATKVPFQHVKELLQSIRPDVKHQKKKLMDRVGSWFAKLFEPRI